MVVATGRFGYRMVRKLKFHEQKLLKKVDFISWKGDSDHREVRVIRKYRLQKREDYAKLSYLALMSRIVIKILPKVQ